MSHRCGWWRQRCCGAGIRHRGVLRGWVTVDCTEVVVGLIGGCAGAGVSGDEVTVGDDFRLVADAVAADIRSGRMRPGQRLLPQREFARRRGMAVSTAARVYQELARRGLVAGAVGRGTFVVDFSARSGDADLVDLEANFPVLPGQSSMVARALGRVLAPAGLEAAMHPVPVTGTRESRRVGASFLSRPGWAVEPERLLFTGSGRQAIAAAMVALVAPGQRLGVEELTYPVVKTIAARHGVTLVPIGMDGEGLSGSALEEAHRRGPLAAVYLQPTLHNPLGVTMSAGRRAELGRRLARLGLVAIEDRINAFLYDEELPLAAHAPEQTILVDSLSKRVGAGLNLGLLVCPVGLTGRVAAAVRSGTWGVPGVALACATAVVADGTAQRIVRLKQQDARLRQAIVAEVLAGFDVRADPRSYHVWWRLPGGWSTGAFVSAAARQRVVVSPAADYAVGGAPVPDAVRLSTSSPDVETLRGSLALLAAIARRAPEEVGTAY
ncbi:PLP-dependent aminotransferase family protein [Micromonospora sp. WMMD987]|uniref:aminotransferase-like domain-containing protein n=1 Tax=Micromonospora sp. WMMD987 TaxID=3016089 RepID=UPI0032B52DBF